MAAAPSPRLTNSSVTYVLPRLQIFRICAGLSAPRYGLFLSALAASQTSSSGGTLRAYAWYPSLLFWLVFSL